jgi:hypothetical protein
MIVAWHYSLFHRHNKGRLVVDFDTTFRDLLGQGQEIQLTPFDSLAAVCKTVGEPFLVSKKKNRSNKKTILCLARNLLRERVLYDLYWSPSFESPLRCWCVVIKKWLDGLHLLHPYPYSRFILFFLSNQSSIDRWRTISFDRSVLFVKHPPKRGLNFHSVLQR